MGMSFYENLVGGYFSGLVLEAILLGVVTVQTFLYYQRFSRDHIALKFSVGFLWLSQAFEVAVSTIPTYRAILYNVPISASKWYDTVFQICAVISSTSVQFYFVFRLYRFSGSIWLPTLLVLVTLVQVGTGLAICIELNITHGIQSMIHPARPIIISWLTLEAAADLIIAVSMSYYLQRCRTGFRQTDTVLRKLTLYAINTGLVTSVLALAVMFAFAFYGFHFIAMILILPLGGVYNASFLANLHSRSRLRKELYSGGERGISIHISRIPHRVQNKINAVAQRIEGHHSDERTDPTSSTGATLSRPPPAGNQATRSYPLSTL